MFPSLSKLSLHSDPTGPGTGPKTNKGKKGIWDSTPIQRAWLENHWKDDTWRVFADLPGTPKNGGDPVPGRKDWNRVVLKPDQAGYNQEEADDLNLAKATAKMETDKLDPPAAPPPSSGGSSSSSGGPSSAYTVPEFVPAPFVPAPFVFDPPPPNPSTLSPDAIRDLVNGKLGGIGSWKAVTDRMDVDLPTWRTAPESALKFEVEKMKNTMRIEKILKAIEEYDEKKNKAEEAYLLEQQKAEEGHDLEQQKAKDKHDNDKALVAKPGANFLLDESATKLQLVRALLRFYFQKKGTKNKLRFWSHKTPGNKFQVPDVSKDLGEKRKKWADAIINELLANGGSRLDFILSLPFMAPDASFFVTGVDPTMNYDIIPSKPVASMEVDGSDAMPEYAGVIKSVGSSSEPCGSKIFFYVKTVQTAFTDGLISTKPPIGEDYGVLDDAKMNKTKVELFAAYNSFLGNLVAYGVNEKEMFGDMGNNVKDYTYGSGRFNRTLRLNPSKINPALFWPATKSYSLEEAKARMGNVYSTLKTLGIGGPEMLSYDTFERICLYKIHSLWRVFVVAPKLPINVPVIRAVNDPAFLPHRIAGISDDSLVPGMAFLDLAFVSTALIAPLSYFSEPLDTFFDTSNKCCMMSLTLMQGMPAIPLFVKSQQLSHYPTEDEIVLPPLCQYVFRSKRTVQVPTEGGLDVYHFDVYPSF